MFWWLFLSLPADATGLPVDGRFDSEIIKAFYKRLKGFHRKYQSKINLFLVIANNSLCLKTLH